jgi:hypothetical protein
MNKIDIVRFIIPEEIPFEKRIKLSLYSIIEFVNDIKDIKANLITPTRRTYDSNKILSKFIKINKTTWKSKINNTPLSLETESTILSKNRTYSEEIFVSYFPSPKMIDFLDSLFNPKCIIVISDYASNFEEWIDIWNPIILNDNEHINELSKVKLDDIVLKLLKKYILRFAIYDKSGLHTNDRDRTIFYFKYLKKQKVNYDVFEIKKYLLRNNSNVYATKEICSIAEGIKNGRSFQIKHYSDFPVELN